MARRILIIAWGSLGDLHPYLAIAQGLAARGHEVLFGTAECYRRKVEALGLAFRPVRPDCDWLADPAKVRYLAHPRWGLVRVIIDLLASLRDSYDDTLAATDGVDLLVTSQAGYASGLVAEQRGVPWASVIHIPTGIFSAYDPPIIPLCPSVSQGLRGLGPRFWGPVGRSLNRILSVHAAPWHRLRAELGLPRVRGINPLTEYRSPTLHLATFSPLLSPQQPDWPAQAVQTGYPWFDEEYAEFPPALAKFLDDGPPPIVFTLGSVISTDAQRFYDESAAAAQRLGRRAVLVINHARNRPATLPASVLAVDYAPFAKLFPRAAATVHHGGIGTTSQAMRSGRPMLIMPCAWDQPDNAVRAARLGIARVVRRPRYTAARAAAELRKLLDDPAYTQRAAEIGERVQQEDGARAACDAIEKALALHPQASPA